MKIAIIGGGAAGLMAAASICEAQPAHEIFVIEKNDGLGKKVLISGGGRCNVTTGIPDVRTVLSRYPRGGKFLSSAMYGFPPAQVAAWFEAHDVPLKTEEDLRVFPRSDNGEDVVRVFEQLFRAPRVHVLLRTSALRVERDADTFRIFLKNHEEPLVTDRLILTTGGQAYRHTGSTGDGYAFAQSLGHTLTPLAPSLNSFTTREAWPAHVSGLSVERATLSVKGTKTFSFTGPFLFTHKGVSGPAVFALSSLVAFEPFDAAHPLAITIDLFPEMTVDDITKTVLEHVAENPKKQFANILSHIVPKSFAEIVQAELALPDRRANETAKADIRHVATWLKHVPLHAVGRGAGDEFVTAGGIDTKEVNPRTMESLLCPGLFFAGEILDIDGFTGGFNLQASWATGRLAGENAARS